MLSQHVCARDRNNDAWRPELAVARPHPETSVGRLCRTYLLIKSGFKRVIPRRLHFATDWLFLLQSRIFSHAEFEVMASPQSVSRRMLSLTYLLTNTGCLEALGEDHQTMASGQGPTREHLFSDSHAETPGSTQQADCPSSYHQPPGRQCCTLCASRAIQ